MYMYKGKEKGEEMVCEEVGVGGRGGLGEEGGEGGAEDKEGGIME